jgi:crotonobetainyl-CoA:carnitine CoA-transferase CaiB-like acyl-CoA transferase
MPAGQFTCGDGKEIMITAGNQPQWLRLCEALGAMELTEDPRFGTVFTRSDNRRALVPLLQAIFDTRPLAEWLEILDAAQVPAGPVYNIAEALEDPQLKSRGPTVTTHHPLYGDMPLVAYPVKFSGETGSAAPLHPPLLGEHTDEVLSEELGLDAAQIAALREKSVV